MAASVSQARVCGSAAAARGSTATPNARLMAAPRQARFAARMPAVRMANAEGKTATCPPKLRNWKAPEMPADWAGPKFDAVVEVAGSQLIVHEGRHYSCNWLKVPAGSKIKLERVLLCKADNDLLVGKPYVEGAYVEATILENYQTEPMTIGKHKPKKSYKRQVTHRSCKTKFLVTKVQAPQ